MVTVAPTLPGMYEDGRSRPRPHKVARKTSREVYRRRRGEDEAAAKVGRETRQGAVLRLLAAFWNRHQHSPTAYELLLFCQEHFAPFRDIAAFRPRLTELTRAGLIEPREARRCRVTGETARTWAVREVGSQEAR